ncbi:FAD-dependent monooxygenase [Actinomadura roseirufa]|uniref:FAD-dependent monooxygenase n=1 Tax=Actinomadura roseirufa TaxID=2094049 RepID=UPI0010410793|nr:FAD-dependent monooxygenase [Actinomadura roseirufa]
MTDVIVVGAGPVGLLLAAELKLAGADPLVLEAADGSVRRARSLGLRAINTQSLRTLALRGLTGRLREAQEALLDELGPAADAHPDRDDIAATILDAVRRGLGRGHFAGLPLRDGAGAKDKPAEYIVVRQHVLERILADHAASLGVEVRTGHEVTDVVDEGTAVRAALADGTSLTAAYLVGCDGGRSTVRKRSGIAFPGTAPTMTGRVAIAELAEPVASSMRHPGGVLSTSLVVGEILIAEFDGGPGDRAAPVTATEIQDSARRVTGQDVTVTEMETGIRFSDNTRQAETYRRGRILLAGDAAHVHSPVGGQGLNLGLQDAANLGWKLALAATGRAPDDLLDTYTTERHPVGARVLNDTRAQTALLFPGPQTEALRDVLAEVLEFPEVRRHFVDRMNGLNIDHAPDAPHPLTGRFIPILPPDSPIAAALKEGRGVLAGPGNAQGFTDRVQAIGTPLPGTTTALIRPDGYIAWASNNEDPQAQTKALSTWFGPRTPTPQPTN